MQAFSLSFLTQLSRCSHPAVLSLITRTLLKGGPSSLLASPLPAPPGGTHLQVEGYWVAVGTAPPVTPSDYVMTPGVRANLRDLARVVSAGYACFIIGCVLLLDVLYDWLCL